MQVPEDLPGSAVVDSVTTQKRDSFAFPSTISSQDQGTVARASEGGAALRARRATRTTAKTHPEAENSPENVAMAVQKILPSTSRPPLTTSIPSPNGHRAHSELLQKVHNTLRPAHTMREAKPVPDMVKLPSVPLPPLEPVPTLLRLVPTTRTTQDRGPLGDAASASDPHCEYSFAAGASQSL